MSSPAVVYGESADDILRALSKSDWNITDDGMYHFDVCLSLDEAGPVCRAVMRAEARLLCEDADHCGPLSDDIRTPEQRAADALFAVVTEAAEAIGLPRTRRRSQ